MEEGMDFEKEAKLWIERFIQQNPDKDIITELPQDFLTAWVVNMNRQQELLLSRRKNKKRMSFIDIKSEIDIYHTTLPQDLDDRLGNCFEYSCEFVKNHRLVLSDEDAYLIHGYAFFKDDGVVTKYCHAWVQINSYMFDPVYNTLHSLNAVTKEAPRYKPAYKFTPWEATDRFLQDGNHGFWGERDADAFDGEKFARAHYGVSKSELREIFRQERASLSA